MRGVFHIGWPKTGTTAFQRNVLSKMTGEMVCLGNNLCNKRSETLQSFLKSGFGNADGSDHFSLELERSYPECFEFFYSEERVSLQLFWSEIDDWGGFIKKVNPEARVLIFIRRQHDWLRSFYLEKKHGGALVDGIYSSPVAEQEAPASFHEWIDALLLKKKNGHKCLLDFIDYAHWYSSLSKSLTEDEILILPYEILLQDINIWAAAVSKFTGIEQELIIKGMSVKEYVTGQRLHDHWAKRFVGPVRKFAPIDLLIGYARTLSMAKKIMFYTNFIARDEEDLDLRVDQRDELVKIYACGNQLLSNRLKADLSSLGYWT